MGTIELHETTTVITFWILALFFYGQLEIRTFDRIDTDIYYWVTSISKGPIFTPKKENEDSKLVEFYRVAISTSEIHNGIYIEKGSMGFEGSSKKIIRRRKVDTDQLHDSLYNRGDLRGEFARF